MELNTLKPFLTDYVNRITERAENSGKNKYICPLCHSGNGENKTAAFSIDESGNRWKCFSCGKGGDIFDLERYFSGIEPSEAIRRISDLYGNEEKTNVKRPSKTADEPKQAESEEEKAKRKAYVEECKNNLTSDSKGFSYLLGRGFNENTIKKLNLGYDPKLDVVVFPYDREGEYFSTRSTSVKRFNKPKGISEPIYNQAALFQNTSVFVCESQIDAISIIQAAQGKAQAIATGGTGFVKLVNILKTFREVIKANLVISYDNDEAGKKAAQELTKELEGLNIPFIEAEYELTRYPEDKQKDANDYLVSNPEQFERDIKANLERLDRVVNAEKYEALKEINSRSGAEALTRIEEINETSETKVISTGFKNLDYALDGGLYTGKLYTLGASSSLGKTTLVLQIADYLAINKQPVLYFSLEMSSTELVSKSLSRLTYQLTQKNEFKSLKALEFTIQNNLTLDKQEIKKRASMTYRQYYADNMFIYEGIGNIGSKQIREQTEKFIRYTGKKPVVIVDYLQILASEDSHLSDKQFVDRAVLDLKRISRDFNLTVIAISSFNRGGYYYEVTEASFKESGAIEYGSDVLLGLQVDGISNENNEDTNRLTVDSELKSEKRNLVVKVIKNRFGHRGRTAAFTYHSNYDLFCEKKLS